MKKLERWTSQLRGLCEELEHACADCGAAEVGPKLSRFRRVALLRILHDIARTKAESPNRYVICLENAEHEMLIDLYEMIKRGAL